ncbi:hypothetical protein IE81DRAFT_13203 [Ceraceosorus guamensis]|uniref:DUF7704 domain-containing protein n=1 Tax=Ceraceosorus guamensis TaxID=1522189 RepID=A0A316VW62_9BASI|nr:hypothetical protein IE81DRAFT_13203 [Ceraceosorus guamensis]PWN39685.1 hypothetical protein IE81DRAFT_13203 [Ceraceosorus guamensis]
MSFQMPLTYRVLFGAFDLLLPIFGTYGHIFAAKNVVLAGFTGAKRGPVWPPAPETRVLLDGMAGWYVALITLQIFAITKRPKDWALWQTLNLSIFFVDAFMLLGFARGLSLEGKLNDTSQWRGQDWGNIAGYAFIGLVRLAFVAGVGVQVKPGGNPLAFPEEAKQGQNKAVAKKKK